MVRGLPAPLLGRGLGTAFPFHLRNVPHTMESIMPAFWIVFGWDARWTHTAQDPSHADFKTDTESWV